MLDAYRRCLGQRLLPSPAAGVEQSLTRVLLSILRVLRLGAIAVGARWQLLGIVGKGLPIERRRRARVIRVRSGVDAPLVGDGW
jgi:hypothetical protein